MQVNIAANVSNPTGETNGKPGDSPGVDAGDAFFCQMGKILNQSAENNDAPTEVKSPVGTAGSNRGSQQRSLPGISLFSGKALNATTAPVPNGSIPIGRLFQGSGCADSGPFEQTTPRGNAGTKSGLALAAGIESRAVPTGNDEKKMAVPVADLQIISVPAAYVDEWPGMQAIVDRGRTAGDGSETTGLPDALYSEETFRDTNKAAVNMRGGTPTPVGVKAELSRELYAADSKAKDVAQPELNRSMGLPHPMNSRNELPDPSTRSAQLNFDFIAQEEFKSRQNRSEDSGSIVEAEDPGSTDNPVALKNTDYETRSASIASQRKPAKATQILQDNADRGSAAGSQEQTAIKSGSWTAVQGKTENGLLHAGHDQILSTEDRLQMQSVVSSGSIQSGEAASGSKEPAVRSAAPQRPELVFQLADQIRIQVHDGKGEIRIQLKPDSLGRLEIRAETTAQGVSARISTESGAVKSYLESNLQLMQQTLQDQGLKIDRIHIVIQDAFDAQSSSGFTAQFGHTGSGQNGKGSHLSSGRSDVASLDPVEETALDPASWLALNPNNRFYTVA